MSLSSDLVTYFFEGIRSASPGEQSYSISSARNHFQWCLHLDSSACDAWRAMASLEGDGQQNATQEQIRAIYSSLSHYGELLRAVNLPETQIAASFDTGMWGTTRKMCTRSDITQAYASLLIDTRDYDTALTLLDGIPGNIPFTRLLKARLFYVTRRWDDVLDQCAGLESAELFQMQSDEPFLPREIDPLISGLSSLMAGEALCFLERNDAAVERLRQAIGAPIPEVASRAAYLTGMAYRGQGNEKKAQEFLAQALSRSNDPQVYAAKNDPGHRLQTTSVEMINARTSYWEHTTEPDLEVHRAEKAESRRSSLLEEAEAKMNTFVGMEAVKRQVEELQAKVEDQIVRKRRGMPVKASSQHIVFTGPPGTGKTTVANVIGMIYAGLGLVREPKVVVTSRPDFVGNTVGSSALKTREKIAEADGGILFIDEAYSLVQETGVGQEDSFGQEAVDVIVTEMDLRRETLVVIIAGYPEDIDRLLATNDGLRSRFFRKIDFASYSPTEIRDIALQVARERGFTLDAEAQEAITATVDTTLMSRNSKGNRTLLDILGNGRFARNVVESAEEQRAVRLKRLSKERGITQDDLSDEELTTITGEDVRVVLERLTSEVLRARPEGEHGVTPVSVVDRL